MKRAYDKITLGRFIRGSIAIVLVVVVYVMSGMYSYNYLNLTEYATTDVVYADGSTAHSDDISFGMLNKGDQATIHVNLPENDRIDNAVIRFYVYHAVVTATYDGRQIYSSGQDIADSGRMIGAQYPIIPIPDEAWGSSIDVTFQVHENEAFSKINELSVYPQEDAYRYFFDKSLFPILVSLVGMIAGLCAAVLLWVRGLRDRQLARGWYIAMAAFLMCSWVFCASGVYNLLGDFYFFRLWDFIALFVMGLPVLAYVASDERDRRMRTVVVIFIIVISATTVIACILDFTGIAHLSDSLLVAHVLDVASTLLLLYVSFFRLRRKDPSSQMLMVGFFCLGAFALVDLLRFNLLKFIPWFDGIVLPSMLHLGITLFIMFMIVAYLVDTQQKSRSSLQLQIEVNELGRQEREQRMMASMSNLFFIRYDHTSKTAIHLFDSEGLFGVDHIQEQAPRCYIEKGYVAEESVKAFEILSAQLSEPQASGKAVICATMPRNSQIAWIEVEFKTEFANDGKPDYSIVSLRDITQEHERDVAFSLYRQRLLSMPADNILYFEYDLTKEVCDFVLGDKARKSLDATGGSWDELLHYITSNYVSENESRRVLNLLNSRHLVQLAEQGQDDLSFDYQASYGRELLSGDGSISMASQWVHVDVNLVLDQYTNDVKVYCLMEDIMGNKATEIELQNSVKKLEKELESSRVKIMVNQMQPHFLYNALSAIRTITKRDPDYAYDLLYDFTNHLRATVRALSSDDLIPFSEEMKNINAYLNIEKMRFGDSLNLEYDIECDDFYVAPLTIQPIAENAARHGVYPKGKEGGTVRIHSYEDSDSYVVEVSDDGVGFDLDQVLNSKADSVGLRSLIFRLDSLMHATVNIDSKIGEGTTVTVRIPKEGEPEDDDPTNQEENALPASSGDEPAARVGE